MRAVESIQGSISNEASISYDDGSGSTITINMVRGSIASGGPDGISSVSQTIGSTIASVQVNGLFLARLRLVLVT